MYIYNYLPATFGGAAKCTINYFSTNVKKVPFINLGHLHKKDISSKEDSLFSI